MSKRNNEPAEETKATETSSESTSATAQASGRFGNLMQLATKLQEAYASGAPINIPALKNPSGSSQRIFSDIDIPAPGVMRLDWVPSIGVSTSKASAANLAMAEIASYIKARVTRRPTWETPDLAIHMLAIDSIYSLHYAAMRAYGLVRRYTPLNKYWPRAIAMASGFDFDDLVNNQNRYLFFLNQKAAELRNLALPGTFRLFAQHMDLNSLIYADGTDDRSQLYVFRQAGFWSYEVVTEQQQLTFREAPDLFTFESFSALYNTLIDALRDSVDVDVITGDIVAAYGDAAISLVPELPFEYEAVITYSENMLLSINNAQFCPGIDYASLAVKDGHNGLLLCQPKSYRDHNSYRFGNVSYLNFYDSELSADKVAAAMRFVTWCSDFSEGLWGDKTLKGFNYNVKYCNTEILTNAKVYYYSAHSNTAFFDVMSFNGGATGEPNDYYLIPGGYQLLTRNISQWRPTWTYAYTEGSSTPISDEGSVLFDVAMLSQFHHHYGMYCVNPVDIPAWGTVSDAEVVRSSLPIMETQHRVPIDGINIDQLTTALLYNAFFN